MKISTGFFLVEFDKSNSKICMKEQIAKNSQKRNKMGGLALPDFKSYYKARVIKTMWV